MFISFFGMPTRLERYHEPSELLLVIQDEVQELIHATRDGLALVRASKRGDVLALRYRGLL